MDTERAIALLASYPIQVREMAVTGASLRLWTDRGCKRLRRAAAGEKGLAVMDGVLEGLAQKGFRRTGRPILDREGRLGTKEGEEAYYLVDWVEGEPLDYSRDEDVVEGAALLGRMHRLTEGMAAKRAGIPWPERVRRVLEEMEHFRGEAGEGGQGFPEAYREGASRWLVEGRKALAAFAGLPGGGPLVYCHRRWRESNLLRKAGGAVWALDFDNGAFDHPAYDLGRFIRRVMARRGWREQQVLAGLMGAYRREYPAFGRAEGDFLLAYLGFPRKPWLVAARFFRGGGPWQESRLLQELREYQGEEAGRREAVLAVAEALASPSA